MLLVRLAFNRGASVSSAPINHQYGSLLARCLPSMTVVKPRFRTTQKSTDEEVDLDAPIKFSTSRAATWKSRHTYSGNQVEVNKRPWYEPFVVIISTGVFLLYFCYFREENDVDNKLNKTLYDHISGLEETQLELSLQHGSGEGADTSAIENRLAEIRQSKEEENLPTDSSES